MDRDDLDDALDRWHEAELIDDETASAIRSFEDDGTDRSAGLSLDVDRRLVEIVSLMGAALVGAGTLLLLWSNWESLGTIARTAVLVLAPVIPGGIGFWLRRWKTPRVGTALWFLAVVLLGPSFVLLIDIHLSEVGLQWPLLAWAICAIPAGYVVASRPTTLLGLLVAFATLATATDSASLPYALSMLGVLMVAGGLLVARLEPHLAEVYRVTGVIPVIASLVFIGIQRGEVETLHPELDALFVAIAIGAILVGAAVALGWYRATIQPGDALGVATPLLGTIVAMGLVSATPPLPALASFLLAHGVLLGVLLGLVAVGLLARSRAVINLVAVAFLVQVLTFLLATVGDVLPGSIALVITGVVLLIVGLLLERGRRRVLGRIGGRPEGLLSGR